MVYILNIETATKKCSVSISKNGELASHCELANEQFNHAEKLHLFIEQCTKDAAITLQDLNAVAVSKGPGSYTGLRIGVSSAKGLCYALEIPLIAINTLDILARQISISNGYIVPMIDARRMEVFTKIIHPNYTTHTPTHSLIIDQHSFTNINEELHLIGDGANKCREILNDSKFIYHPHNVFPSSEQMCHTAYHKYLNEEWENLAYFEPFYLKDFMLNTPHK